MTFPAKKTGILAPLTPVHRTHDTAYLLEPSSHPILDGRSALLLALDTKKLVGQPAHMRSALSPYVLCWRINSLQLFSDGVDAVDQDFLLAAPNDDSADNFVETSEPVSRS